jgi:hypothetical protein
MVRSWLEADVRLEKKVDARSQTGAMIQERAKVGRGPSLIYHPASYDW